MITYFENNTYNINDYINGNNRMALKIIILIYLVYITCLINHNLQIV